MEEKLDLREKGGVREGERQVSDTRMFMQLLAFGECMDCAPLIRALRDSRYETVLYEDLNDSRGVALLAWNENPDFFLTMRRTLLLEPPFVSLTPRLEYSMIGRTYALGYEPNLQDWLLHRPRRTVLNPDCPWAIWYPLRRTGAFSALPPEEQTPILREHGSIGLAFGKAGYAHDVRLSCFGLDKNDNDFVIGLIGHDLYPLSACVQAMRKTRQTSQYIQAMGPFFIGKAIWQSSFADIP
ncbi:MAG: chlorite dismutase family protein [Acidobacteria bacterium]|nr:chlorite dismutase family protein [Acidobacteriota bacterium]MBI3657947.1 chlorite dismutase family protein [Acidobacteriota bacterium]